MTEGLAVVVRRSMAMARRLPWRGFYHVLDFDPAQKSDEKMISTPA
jgi:hypothetical protein